MYGFVEIGFAAFRREDGPYMEQLSRYVRVKDLQSFYKNERYLVCEEIEDKFFSCLRLRKAADQLLILL